MQQWLGSYLLIKGNFNMLDLDCEYRVLGCDDKNRQLGITDWREGSILFGSIQLYYMQQTSGTAIFSLSLQDEKVEQLGGLWVPGNPNLNIPLEEDLNFLIESIKQLHIPGCLNSPFVIGG